MAEKIRVVHYLNQFFAQIGGEEKADIGPGFKEGPTGPGRALQQTLAEHGEVIATFFCGDNYFAEHSEEAKEELLRQITRFNPQLLIAGPAFESGRYGVACGAICHGNSRATRNSDCGRDGCRERWCRCFIASTSTSSIQAIQSSACCPLSSGWLPWDLNWCRAHR